jgi:hypothetical protein
MARRLKQPSVRQVAAQLAVLTHTAVPHPLSLRGLMALFATVARPEKVKNILPSGNYSSGTLGLPVSWSDPGANTFRYATRFHVLMDGLGRTALDTWSTSDFVPENDAQQQLVDQEGLQDGHRYYPMIQAWNEWGGSEWNYSHFDVGSPSSTGSGNPPPPPPQRKPSGIFFWNCDTTSVSAGNVEHLPVYFWLFDLTAGSNWNQLVEPGYDAAGSCGPSFTDPQITIPAADTTTLVAGDEYRWMIVKPDNPGCDGNDPNNAACVAATGTFTAGGDAPLIVPWSNA